MTDEHPPEPRGQRRCENCGQKPTLVKGENRLLYLECRCEKVSIRVSSTLPSRWTE
jgi:hypothetical protein